jgi:hypothetical protein
VFRFIIECNNLRDFGLWVTCLFLYEEFRKMTFWLVLKQFYYMYYNIRFKSVQKGSS